MSKRIPYTFLILILATLSIHMLSRPVHGSILPPNFEDIRIVGGLSEPDHFAFAPDGRLFISERVTGRLLVAKYNAAQGTWAVNSEPFFTFDVPKPEPRRSAGLRSIAFDPDFNTNGYIYAFYMRNGILQNRVVRLKASVTNPDIADLSFGSGGEETLIQLPFNATYASGSHNGGALLFGTDGKLYISTGDGWEGEFAGDPVQSLQTFTGKILRINTDGSIPSDNPFYGQTTGSFRAIYALGLRNPYSMARHPTTGSLYINEARGTAKADIYIVEPGANYGHEGQGIGTLRAPWANAATGIGGNLITGGAWYPQSGPFPTSFYGKYFAAMWGSNEEPTGQINTIASNSNTSVALFASSIGDVGSNGWPVKPVITQIGPDGNLYYMLTTYLTNAGSVHMVRYTSQGTVATPAIAPAGGSFSQSVTVEITCSTVGAIIHYTLDGSEPTPTSPQYVGAFVVENDTTVKAKAFKSGMNPSSVASVRFMADIVGNQPPIIDAGADRIIFVNNVVALDGSGSVDPDGNDDLMYDELWTQLGGPTVTILDATEEIAYFSPLSVGTYEFELEIKDEQGDAGSDRVIFTVVETATPLPVFEESGRFQDGRQAHAHLAGFSFPGRTGDIEITFDAWDIDSPTDMAVIVNGVLHEYVAPMGNVQPAGADAVEVDNEWTRHTVTLPDHLVNDTSENLVAFGSNVNPPALYYWGIRNLVLGRLVVAPNTLPDDGTYGFFQDGPNSHQDQVAYVFEGQTGNGTLSFEAWDIDPSTEVAVILNGALLGYVPAEVSFGVAAQNDPNIDNEWSAHTFVLPNAFMNDSGPNLIVFDNMDYPSEISYWGIRKASVTFDAAAASPARAQQHYLPFVRLNARVQ